MIKIKINGIKHEADPKDSILDAARKNGVYIPAICYSDRFGAIGACRVCVVEIVGQKRPMLSCVMKVKDGMEIITESDALNEARKKIVLEWDHYHPLQCGICDKSGECELQNINYDFNITENPLEKETDLLSIPNRTIHYEWRIIHHDANLCIQCRRCVTICDKVVNFGILALVKKDWGGREIDTKDGLPLDCEFCGQCVSVCPTGAMSSKLFQYQARPWELKKVRTTCQFCSSGCQMDLNIKNNKILRVTSEDNTPNKANLCNLGRFNYSVIEQKNILDDYLVEKVSKNERMAIEEAVKLIQSVRPEEVFGLCGARSTLEDAYTFKLLFENGIKSANLDSFASTHIGKLLHILPASVRGISKFEDIEKSDLIISFGCDVANEIPRLDWQLTRSVKFLKKAKLITIYWRDTKIDTLGSLPLRYKIGDEVTVLEALTNKISAGMSEFGSDIDKITDEQAYLIDENIYKLITEAKKISFVVGQEALERSNGYEVAKAVSNLALMLKDKITLFISTKYNNAYGDIYAGIANGFDAYGKLKDYGLSIYQLPELIRNGSIKVLVLFNAEIFDVLSDNDAEFVLNNTKVILIGTYKSKMARYANVVLPVPTFVNIDGVFVNLEGKMNRIRKVFESDFKPAWKLLSDMSMKLGHGISTGEIGKITAKDFMSVDGTKDEFYSVKAKQSLDYEKTGLLLFSKFRSSTFSSFGEGASIASSESLVVISNEDAKELSIRDGDYAVVESDKSSVRLKAKIDDKMPKNVVGIYLWYDNINGYNLSGSFNNIFNIKQIKKGE